MINLLTTLFSYQMTPKIIRKHTNTRFNFFRRIVLLFHRSRREFSILIEWELNTFGTTAWLFSMICCKALLWTILFHQLQRRHLFPVFIGLCVFAFWFDLQFWRTTTCDVVTVTACFQITAIFPKNNLSFFDKFNLKQSKCEVRMTGWEPSILGLHTSQRQHFLSWSEWGEQVCRKGTTVRTTFNFKIKLWLLTATLLFPLPLCCSSFSVWRHLNCLNWFKFLCPS